jgi:hypothetical protein
VEEGRALVSALLAVEIPLAQVAPEVVAMMRKHAVSRVFGIAALLLRDRAGFSCPRMTRREERCQRKHAY